MQEERRRTWLRRSDRSLAQVHDVAMLDLDGVVYIGRRAVPGVEVHLARARRAGLQSAFVTNNASRTPAEVAAHLVELGVPAAAEDVVTSAQAAAHLLRERLGAGAHVYFLGALGLEEALRAEGLVPVLDRDARPRAVVTGYGPDVPWRRLMEGAMLVREGLPWVACNADHTFPTDHGPGPGHGVQVRMIADFTGVDPTVAGKPQVPLLDETVRRVSARRPLMVGDRLDTDIEGAANAGVDSLLVLTGVTGLAELVAAPPRQRPTYLAPDLAGLTTAHPAPSSTPDGVELGGWRARVADGRLSVEGRGHVADWWRVVACGAWRHFDETGTVVAVDGLDPPG